MATVPITWDSTFDYPPAFAGMLADDMFTDKQTIPCGATTQPFGTVVAIVVATGISVLPIGTNVVQGIAIHDHRFAGRITTQEGYVQYDAMSVIMRGRVWCRANGACTKDGPVGYDPLTGFVGNVGVGPPANSALPNARFLSTALTIPGIESGSQMIVLVELHHPQA